MHYWFLIEQFTAVQSAQSISHIIRNFAVSNGDFETLIYLNDDGKEIVRVSYKMLDHAANVVASLLHKVGLPAHKYGFYRCSMV